MIQTDIQIFKPEWQNNLLWWKYISVTHTLCKHEQPLVYLGPSQVTTSMHHTLSSTVVNIKSKIKGLKLKYLFEETICILDLGNQDLNLTCWVSTWSALFRTTRILSSCPRKDEITRLNSSLISSLWGSNKRRIRSHFVANHDITPVKS